MLDLIYITNNPQVAKIAEDSGVDWIFVDMEFIGKDDRQGGLDTSRIIIPYKIYAMCAKQ